MLFRSEHANLSCVFPCLASVPSDEQFTNVAALLSSFSELLTNFSELFTNITQLLTHFTKLQPNFTYATAW